MRDPRLETDAAGARSLELDDLFQRIAAETVDAPVSSLERVRRMPTSWRRLAAVILLLAVGAGSVAWQGLRPDLPEPAPRLALLSALLGGAALLGFSQALRPLHRPPPSLPWGLPALLLGLGGLALALGGWPGLPVTPEPARAIHLGCALATAIGSASLALGTLSLDRGMGTASWRIATAAVASALAAFAIQALVCPVVELAHLVGAHAGPGLLLAVLLLVLNQLRGRT